MFEWSYWFVRNWFFWYIPPIWPTIQLIFSVFVASTWASILLLIFTLTSSPYNSHQATRVLKSPQKSPRRKSIDHTAFDDGGAISNAEASPNPPDDETKDDMKQDTVTTSGGISDTTKKNNKKDKINDKTNGRKRVDTATKQRYKKRKSYRAYLRMYFTLCVIIPIVFFASLVVNFFQLLARLSHPIFPYETRMYMASWLAARWLPLLYFLFEYWTNLKYRIHVENPDLWKHVLKENILLIPNHAESPYDWLAALSFGDFLGRTNSGYSVMKRLFRFIPMVGWTSLLSGSLALNRKWDQDKGRLRALFDDMKHVYQHPFFFVSYPEGTRQNPKKLKESQEFARKRGYTVLNNLLQPRVKGFVFFCQELGHKNKTVKYVVDMTNLYLPKPPPMERMAYGRLHDSLEMVIRIWKVSDLPEDTEELGTWLREMYVEKDQLIDRMQAGKIKTEPLYRDPLSSVLHYAFYCILFAYSFHFIFKLSLTWCLIFLVNSLFPILMLYVERFNNNLHEFLLSADFSISGMFNASIARLTGQYNKNMNKLGKYSTRVGRQVGHQLTEMQDSIQNQYQNYQNRGKAERLSQEDFVSLEYGDNDDNGMDVKSDTELFEPALNDVSSNLSYTSNYSALGNNDELEFASVSTGGYRDSR